jgi:hypothetical protein
MVNCVNDIGVKLNSKDPILAKNWPNYYGRFKQEIVGNMRGGKKEIIDGSIYEIITLDNGKTIVGSVYHFNAITNFMLSGKWDHLKPEESIRRVDGYLKEAIKLAKLVDKDAHLVNVTFERDKIPKIDPSMP